MAAKEKPYVVIGLLGSTLDSGKYLNRWEKWRPSVALCQHEDLLIDRLELLYEAKHAALAKIVSEDIKAIAPETTVRLSQISIDDPWDFEQMYGLLHDFAANYNFNTDKEDYLIHITTGTHVAQICLFLLTETRYFPAKLIQTSPPTSHHSGEPGKFTIIDLDLSKYDRIASRFRERQDTAISFLKSGIETRNSNFNRLIERIEQVAITSKAPILLMGATGAGKSQLAKRIYQLKKSRHLVTGKFVEVNCATLRGDAAMSTLFGHIKGAFTGAIQARPGLLRTADGGLLFLDEIGELGQDEQAMLLRALEEKLFLPLGADHEVSSNFQLIAGTNRDLSADVQAKRFREDLLARINLWTFHLPSLRERQEDIEPNLAYELEQYGRVNGKHITISKEAKEEFLRFALSPTAKWSGNFRDLNAAITRMATLAIGGRISLELVAEEIARLRMAWRSSIATGKEDHLLVAILGREGVADLDRFDQIQLADVLIVCHQAETLSEAGRLLFNASRAKKKNLNDADRLRKYLAKFGIEWRDIKKVALS
jgi:transcriptional regulatory protein RtcR